MKQGKSIIYTAMWILLATATVSATDVYSLNPVVVTATRYHLENENVPASVSVITGKEMEEKGYGSIYEAVRHVPGVGTNGYGDDGIDYGGMYSRVNVRGFDMGTLVMVNGLPVNMANYNHFMNVIPPSAVEKVEIVKGANSVLYGSQAMGGVVNIITKKGTGDLLQGEIGGSAGNYKNSFHGSMENDKLLLSFERNFLGALNENKVKRLQTPTTSRVYRGTQQNSKLFFSLRPTEKWTFTYAYLDTSSLWGSRTYNDKTKTWSYKETPYDHVRQNMGVYYDDETSGWRSSLSYNDLKFIHGGDPKNNNQDRSWNWDTAKTWSFRDGRDSFTVGVFFGTEYYDKPTKPIVVGTGDDKASYGDLKRTQYAAYASYAWQATKDLTVIFGGREHYVKKNVYDNGQRIFLPQVQSLYRINDEWNWYVNAGKAFQIPQISAGFGKSSGISPLAGQVALKPERSVNYETGFKYYDGKRSFQAAYFRMRVQDKFKWVPQEYMFPHIKDNKDTSLQVNLEEFKNEGIELAYKQTINERWQYSLGVYMGNPLGEEDGKWIQQDAKRQYTASVDYHSGKWNASLECLYLGQREWALYNLNGTKRSGEESDHRIGNTVDLSFTVGYHPTEHDVIVLSLRNILNRHNPLMYTEYYALPFNASISYAHRF